MKSIRVLLWGTEIGVVSENSNNPNYYIFKYNDDFIRSNIEVCPIIMKLSNQTYMFDNLNIESFKGLPPLISDSLPDKYGETLLNAWKIKNNKASLNPLEVLSYIGKRGMGALEFEPCFDDKKEPYDIEIDSLLEVAKEVLTKRSTIEYNIKDEKNLYKLIDVGSSIGGARAKAIIAMDKDGNIKSGQIPNLDGYSYYVLKFDGLSNDLSEDTKITYYTRIEYSYYLMARDSKINISDSKLLVINNKYHFLTKRFDRDEYGRKIHMLSLSGMMGYDFMKAGYYSYEDVALLLKELNADYSDIVQLYRRMVFNVLTKNNDDHVKNISFLMDRKGNWSLSPAYDLSYSYNPNGEWTRHHQMRINDKVDNITYMDLLSSASKMTIKKAQAIEIINEIHSVVDNYYKYAKEANLPDEIIKEISDNYPKI